MKKLLLLTGLLMTLGGITAYQLGWLASYLPREKNYRLPSREESHRLKPNPEAINLQDSFAKVAEVVKPAVVNISAIQITRLQKDSHEFFFGDPNEFFHRFFRDSPRRFRKQEFRTKGTGSGVIIDSDGLILTNNHVIEGAEQLTVTLSDGKKYKGKVVGSDPRTDLAILRIKDSRPFPFAPLGNSSAARVGDWVLAVGSPFGLEQTVTAGIISAIRQSLTIEGRAFRDLLQTDAAINRGNSGGPLVNLRGEVVGINTAIYAPTGVFSGVGFAIPVNEPKRILNDLVEKGYVERSWMGVEIADVDEVIAKQFGLKEDKGALINRVLRNSPAKEGGLQRGDVILEFDGKKVKDVMGLQDIVSETPIHKDVKVTIIREKKKKVLDLKTAAMPKDPIEKEGLNRQEEDVGEPATGKWLGAKFSELNRRLRARFDLQDESDGKPVQGLLVLVVPADSRAAEAGLQEGFIVRKINQVKVTSIAELKKVSKGAKLEEGIVFDIYHHGRAFYSSYKSLP